MKLAAAGKLWWFQLGIQIKPGFWHQRAFGSASKALGSVLTLSFPTLQSPPESLLHLHIM